MPEENRIDARAFQADLLRVEIARLKRELEERDVKIGSIRTLCMTWAKSGSFGGREMAKEVRQVLGES